MSSSRLLKLRSYQKHMSRVPWKTLATYFVLYVVPLIAITAFVNLSSEVSEGETLFYDDKILLYIHSLNIPFSYNVMVFVTDLGGPVVLPMIVFAVSAFLILRRFTWQAILLSVGVVGSALINVILKLIFDRQRPQLWERIVIEHSPSFPSGHAMASCSLALCLILVAWHTKYRFGVTIAATFFTILVGLSRLYFGVHYPTDILAGWLMSIGWVLGVYAILRKLRYVMAQNTNQSHDDHK